MRRRAGNFAKLLPWVICLIVSHSVFAQSADAPAPAPVRSTLDERNVDLVNGVPRLTDSKMEIGPSDIGLSFHRTHLRNNLMYVISHVKTGTDLLQHVQVSLGTQTETFSVANGVYTSDQASGSTLTEGTTNFTYISGDGTIVIFDKTMTAGGRYYLGDWGQNPAISVTYPSGKKLFFAYKPIDYTYSTGGGSYITWWFLRLQSVYSSTGYMWKIYYEADSISSSTIMGKWLHITGVKGVGLATDYCDPSADSCPTLTQNWPTTTYGYSTTTVNQVETIFEYITDPIGSTTRYTRRGSAYYGYQDAPSGALIGVKLPASSVNDLSFSYFPNVSQMAGQVQAVSVNGQGTWNYTYEDITPNGNGPTRAIIVKAPGAVLGKRIESLWADMSFDPDMIPMHFNPLNFFDENGNKLALAYDANDRVTTETAPEGNHTTYSYGSRGNVSAVTRIPKNGSGLGALAVSADYAGSCGNSLTCNKPNWTRDAKGQQTDYTYSPTHGGVLSAMKPAAVIGTPGAQAAVRPLTLATWVQRYASIKNPAGVLVQSPDPMWMISTVTECQTAPGSPNTPTCDAGAPQSVTTNEYGASGTREALLVKGVAVTSGGVTLRTCYSYDLFDRRVSGTKPAANLGVCP